MGEQSFIVIVFQMQDLLSIGEIFFKQKNYTILEAEQVSSDDDDDDDNEVYIPYDDDDDDDDLDSSSGSEEIPEASGKVQQLTIQEEDGEELESEQEQEPDRIKIHE